MSQLDNNEFRLLRDYVEKNCGIHVDEQKAYLVETRLLPLMVENGCRTFTEFYYKAIADKSLKLRDKIIDAMTTNETLWFRDQYPYTILTQEILPAFATEIANGTRKTIRIWSAACSTGQEPYSVAITIREYARLKGLDTSCFEIIATDISPTVLFLAQNGRYDSLIMSRGMPDDLRKSYFQTNGKVWTIDDSIKKAVSFRKLNLQEDFSFMGKLDIIFCRNVLIYFSEPFKRNILNRMSKLLQANGTLFVGASESIISYSNDYVMKQSGKSIFYKVKQV